MDDKAGASTSQPRSSLQAWKSSAARFTSSSAVAEEVNRNRPLAAKTKAKSTRPGVSAAPQRRSNEPPDKPVPLNKQVKDVLQFLQDGEGYVKTWEEIAEGIPAWYDLSEGGELRKALRENPRVEWAAGGLAYRSEHGIRNREDLLLWLRSHPEGTKLQDIKDAYKAVLSDVEALQKEYRLYRFFNYDDGSEVLFPVDERLQVELDPDMKELFLKTAVPSDPSDLQAALAKMGEKSALASVHRKRVTMPMPEKKARKKRAANPRTVTNAHLVGTTLFQGDGPDTIDVLPP